MKQHFIYIPGLGDSYDPVRQFFLKTWRLRGDVSTELVSMHWSSGESYESKVRRVQKAIGRAPKDAEVVLVGESAGGAVAVAVCAATNLRCVTVCGKNLRVSTIGDGYSSKNIALKPAVAAVDKLHEAADLPVDRIRVLYSQFDQTVHPDDSKIPGAQTRRFKIPTHMLAIAWINLFHFGALR